MRRNSAWLTALLALLLAAPAGAQVFQSAPRIELRDNGATLGWIRAFNCVPAGICTFADSVGTITITGGGAPTDAQYWVGAAHAGLSAEHNLGALATGLVLNTAGTPSAYGGTSCTNQVLTALTASGAGTCVTLTSAYTSGNFPATAHNLLSSTHGDTTAASVVRGDILRGNSTPAWSRLALGGNNLYLKSNATDLVYSTLAAGGVGSCTNQAVTALNADTAPTCSTITSAFTDSTLVPSTRTISTTAPLSGGGDLSANRTITTSMSTARLLGRTTAGTGVAEEISVSAPLTFSALALGFDQTAALGNNARVAVRKNSGAVVGTRRQVNLIEGANVTLTVTDDAGSEEVDVTIAAAGGGGGGGNFVEVEVNFGTSGDTNAATVVTGQTWVASNSKIVCAPTAFSTADRADGAEDASIEQLTCVPHTRVVATGFTVSAHVANGNARGRFLCHCAGA